MKLLTKLILMPIVFIIYDKDNKYDKVKMGWIGDFKTDYWINHPLKEFH